MRAGLRPDELKDDVSWWIEKQKEIEFAFGVLEGMGLANRVAGPAENEVLGWSPSNVMKRIYRNERSYHRYRRARDVQLKNALAGRQSTEQPNESRLRVVSDDIASAPIS